MWRGWRACVRVHLWTCVCVCALSVSLWGCMGVCVSLCACFVSLLLQRINGQGMKSKKNERERGEGRRAEHRGGRTEAARLASGGGGGGDLHEQQLLGSLSASARAEDHRSTRTLKCVCECACFYDLRVQVLREGDGERECNMCLRLCCHVSTTLTL